MRLQLSEPHGVIYGEPPVPGAKYEQAGRYFKANGELIGDADPVEVKRATATDDYRSKSTQELRQIADIYGIEWTTRNEVIRQLEGRG